MQIDPSTPSINIKSISQLFQTQSEAGRMRNQATSALQKSSNSEKPQASRQVQQAVNNAVKAERDSYNQRVQTVKNTTAQVNEKTKQIGLEANILMAKAISPPGSKMHPQQLGQFIDKFA